MQPMRSHLPNGSWPVYPGHPITVAWYIVNKYPSFEEAIKVPAGREFENALADNDIPGAGGEVVGALTFLKKLVDGEPWESAVAWADARWRDGKAGGHGRKVAPGLAQANYVKPLLKAKSSWWKKCGSGARSV